MRGLFGEIRKGAIAEGADGRAVFFFFFVLVHVNGKARGLLFLRHVRVNQDGFYDTANEVFHSIECSVAE